MKINREHYLDNFFGVNKRNPCAKTKLIQEDLEYITDELNRKLLNSSTMEHTGAFILDKDLHINAEYNKSKYNEQYYKVGSVVLVNPGSDNIGQEERYPHYYIVLAYTTKTIVGVPITNMGKDKETGATYLRHKFEVELKNPDSKKKPYREFWVRKPSVVDIRNIAGLDKRRIITKYNQVRFAPSCYMKEIKDGMKKIFNIN